MPSSNEKRSKSAPSNGFEENELLTRVLRSFPWFTDVALRNSDITLAVQRPPLESTAYETLISTLIKNIRQHPLSGPSSPVGWVQDHLSEKGTFRPSVFKSNERTSRLASYLLEYRLLDVVMALDIGFSSYSRLERQAIPIPPKMYFSLFSDWPSLLRNGLELLRQVEWQDTAGICVPGSCDQTATILLSLARRSASIEAHNILSNFEAAAGYLSLISKGLAELPSTMLEFKSFLIRVTNDTFPEQWDNLMRSLKSPHSFKLPLQLSLGFSPICLFLLSNLITKDLNRGTILQMWQGIGGVPPSILATINREMWAALCDMGLGLHPPIPRLQVLFRRLEDMINFTLISPADASWLSGGPPPSPSTVSDGDPGISSLAAPPIVTETNATNGIVGQVGETNEPVPRAPSANAPSAPSKTNVVSGAGRKRTPSTAGLDSALDVSVKRKRVGSLPEEGSLPEGGMITEVIDLTIETAGYPTITTYLRNVSNSELQTFASRYLYEEEAVWHNNIANAMLGHPAHPFEIGVSFQEVNSELFRSPAQAQSVLNKGHLVFQGVVSGDVPAFDEAYLGTFAALDQVRDILDFAEYRGERRVAHGTLRQVIQAARSDNPYVLQAPDVPSSSIAHLPAGISSDLVAWDLTIDQPWCRRHREKPRSLMLWVTVSLKGAYTPFKIPDNGFGLFIRVSFGSQWIVVARPEDPSPGASARLSYLNHFQRPGLDLDLSSLQLDTFYARSGTCVVLQPNTPYAVIASDNSICEMGYYMATSTLRRTCYGFLHSFATLPLDHNPTHDVAWTILCRLVHYYHMIYTGGVFSSNPHECAHVPNILNPTGLLDLLSLINIIELAEVLNYARYFVADGGPPDYRSRHILEVRRLSRDIVKWLESHLNLRTEGGRPLGLTTDIWHPYIARQLKATMYHAAHNESKSTGSVTPDKMRRLIRQVYSETSGVRIQLERLNAWVPDSFEWADIVPFTISLVAS
ncbi:hypothetical protein DFP72DRAFT_853295 [Ephemerocybe angulata]|uniref:Uncharacterized protein n=1 Tax=Ephemerocybe angulata TaxID=980116 RepID=A0A8H6LYD5_9AGAR|nr:hypothetical protein DFP72DRAFT_853295 [Tulosesus angulatus]